MRAPKFIERLCAAWATISNDFLFCRVESYFFTRRRVVPCVSELLDGFGGQYIIVIPEKDAVVVDAADLQDMQAELNLVWDYILPALK